VSRKESDHPLRMVVRVGEQVAPESSAMGRVIMSYLPRERRESLLGSLGGRAPAVLHELTDVLEAARESGYVIDEESFAAGTRCVAAAFFDASGGPVGGVSIAGPVARFTDERARRAVEPLLEETRRISHELGYTPTPAPVS
jgi:DNA-binding IclR family transcriptional regulator